MAKVAVERKKAAQREVLGTRDEVAKDRFMEAYKEENRKVKSCIYQSKKEVNEQFGRKMKEVDKVNGGKGGELQQIKGWK